jgi:hypothetical protein
MKTIVVGNKHANNDHTSRSYAAKLKSPWLLGKTVPHLRENVCYRTDRNIAKTTVGKGLDLCHFSL